MPIQDLKVLVTVNVSNALESLESLEESLGDVADKIRRVDERGAGGIDVTTDVDSIRGDLDVLSSEIERWEQTNSIDIDVDTDSFDAEQFGKRTIKPSIDRATTDIAAMSVDADVVNVHGFEMPQLEETVKNGVYRGLVDAIADEDLTAFITGRGSDDDGDDGDDDDDRSQFSRMLRGLRRLRSPDVDLGEKFRTISRTMGNLSENSKLTNLSMSDLHNAVARIVPLLLTFIGTIPALIATFVTLAAAAAAAAASLVAIGGLGLLGALTVDGTTEVDTERLQEMMDNIQQDFLDAFVPLAEQLEPMFRDALNALDPFFQSLANTGDALMALTDEARGFGQFVMGFLPDALRVAAGLVEAFGEDFAAIGRFIDANFYNIVRTAVQVTQEALPAVSNLVQQIAAMIPVLVRMSVGFVKVTSAVLTAIGAIGWVLSMFNISAETTGLFIAAILTAATVVFILAGAISVLAGTAIADALVAIGSFIVKQLVATQATWLLNSAVAGLIGLLTLGIGLGVAAWILDFTSKVTSARSEVDKLSDSVASFDRVARGTGGYDIGMGGSGPSGNRGRPSGGSGGRSVTYNVEGADDPESTAKYLSWRELRTQGDTA